MSFTVYIHEHGQRKPRKVGPASDGQIKDTIEVDGRTFYWVTADLDAKTLTYTDIRPKVQEERCSRSA